MKKNINQATADRINEMKLSEQAQDMIAQTDINVFAEVWGNCETAEDVEGYVAMVLAEDEDDDE